MELSQKEKLFPNFLLPFWNLYEILTILNQKMTVTAILFPKLRTLKTLLEKCLKSPIL